jgi:hypothetical protein
MDASEVIAQLSRFGLTTYEVRAYVALLGRGSFTAADVARLAGLPRQRIYDVLGALAERGLASVRQGSVLKYAAVEPGAAIARLLELQRDQLRALEEQAALLTDTLSPVYEAGRQQTDPLSYIEVLRDRQAISTRFAELESMVEREILVFNKPPYAIPPEENLEGLEVARKYEARGLYEQSLFDDPKALAGVRRFIEVGEEARVVPELPVKLVIIHEAVVMFGMNDPLGATLDITIVVVENPSLATVLKTAFNAYWERGRPLE